MSVSNFDKISISREQLQLVATARRRAARKLSEKLMATIDARMDKYMMPPCNLRMQSNETTNACSKGCVILLYVASFMVHTISSNGNFNGPGSKTKLR